MAFIGPPPPTYTWRRTTRQTRAQDVPKTIQLPVVNLKFHLPIPKTNPINEFKSEFGNVLKVALESNWIAWLPDQPTASQSPLSDQ